MITGIEIGLWLVAVGTPLAWSDAVAAEYALPKLLVLTLGVLLAAGGIVQAGGLRWPPLTPVLGVWAVVIAASAWRSIAPVLSLLGNYNDYAYGVLAMGLYAAVYLAAAQLAPDPRRRVVTASVATGGFVGLYAAAQGLGYEPFQLSVPIATIAGRAVATIGSPVHLGAYLALILPVALFRAAGPGFAWKGGTLLVLGGLAATITRGAWLAAVVGVAAYLILRGGRRGILALLAALLLGGTTLAPALMRQRIGLGQSDVGRVEAWRMALTAYQERPLLGHGPDTYGLLSRRLKTEGFVRATNWRHHHNHAHNEPLQVAATMGVLGWIAYWALMAFLARAAWVRRGDPEAAALAGGLVALLANTMVNPASLEVYATAAIFAGALVPARDGDGSRPTAVGLLLATLLAAITAVRLVAADGEAQVARIALGRSQRVRALEHLDRALELNPCEAKYQILRVNELLDRAREERSVVPLRQAAGGLVATARCHPADPTPLYIMGQVLLMRAQLGETNALPVAQAAIAKSLRLDPTFTPLHDLQIAITKMRMQGK